MSKWQNEYVSALEERDKTECAGQAIYLAYGRAVNLTRSKAKAYECSTQRNLLRGDETRKLWKNESHNTAPQYALEELRQNLTQANKFRTSLEAQLDNVTGAARKMQLQLHQTTYDLQHMTSHRDTLLLGLHDRDSELREKTKMLEGIQIENVSLTLQLNMAETKVAAVSAENSDLLARWLKHKNQEVNSLSSTSQYS